jgi:hypothetical protein
VKHQQFKPPDLGIKSALRFFGHDRDFFREDTIAIGEMGIMDLQ